jgi:Zn-finger nucleic acid-binding protein
MDGITLDDVMKIIERRNKTKEYMKEYNRRYRAEHKEYYLRKKREYYHRDKEKKNTEVSFEPTTTTTDV